MSVQRGQVMAEITGDERVWEGFEGRWNVNLIMNVRQDVVRKKLRARRDSRTARGRPQGWQGAWWQLSREGLQGKTGKSDTGSFWEGSESQARFNPP